MPVYRGLPNRLRVTYSNLYIELGSHSAQIADHIRQLYVHLGAVFSYAFNQDLRRASQRMF